MAGEARENSNKVAWLKRRGFDKSYTRDGAVYVRCSQCSAIVINGHPVHEAASCPNERKTQVG